MITPKKNARIVNIPSWTKTLQDFKLDEERTYSNKELRIDKMRRYCSAQKKKGFIFEVNEDSLNDSYKVTRIK